MNDHDPVVAEVARLPDRFILWHRAADDRYVVLLRAPATEATRAEALAAMASWRAAALTQPEQRHAQ